ncbi:MAG: hypothetical protein KA028_01280 [Candidatus Pacebacteria bacterium]|nr:hypothetical protein [Candidatus Paceibacterota bacterium]MBP9851858.1 hypothetical protein [Candidatus Paceibacterota bacterium]
MKKLILYYVGLALIYLTKFIIALVKNVGNVLIAFTDKILIPAIVFLLTVVGIFYAVGQGNPIFASIWVSLLMISSGGWLVSKESENKYKYLFFSLLIGAMSFQAWNKLITGSQFSNYPVAEIMVQLVIIGMFLFSIVILIQGYFKLRLLPKKYAF